MQIQDRLPRMKQQQQQPWAGGSMQPVGSNTTTTTSARTPLQNQSRQLPRTNAYLNHMLSQVSFFCFWCSPSSPQSVFTNGVLFSTIATAPAAAAAAATTTATTTTTAATTTATTTAAAAATSKESVWTNGHRFFW